MMNLQILLASLDEKSAIEELLSLNHLSTQNILERNTIYFVAKMNNSEIVGVVGLEMDGKYALLRSASVHPKEKNRGIGRLLITELINYSKSIGINVIYLFSTGAGGYWKKFGFQKVETSEVEKALPNTYQVDEYVTKGSMPHEIAWRKDL